MGWRNLQGRVCLELMLDVTAAPNVLYEDDELEIAAWCNVVYNRWKTTPTKLELQRLGEIQREVVDSVPGGRVMSVTVISREAGVLLDAPARKEAERLAREGRRTLIGLAQVVEGTGFAAATTRAVMSGVQLAVRPGYPAKVFSSIDESMPWVEGLLRDGGHHDVAAGVRTVIQGVRRSASRGLSESAA